MNEVPINSALATMTIKNTLIMCHLANLIGVIISARLAHGWDGGDFLGAGFELWEVDTEAE